MALLLAALLVAADQISKAWVVAALPEGSREVPLGLGFYIVHIRNNGAAFGMLRNLHLKVGPVDVDGTILLGILSAVVALVIALYLARNGGRLAALTRVALALVLAGAVGNMIDRFRLHYVVDFIHFHVRGFDFAVFNLADASIVIGAALLLLASVLHSGTPAAKAASTGARSPRHPRTDASPTAGPDFPDLPPLRPELRPERRPERRDDEARGDAR
ncbi:MAG: signal peptidase II [Deinococcales bacterium]